MDKENAGYGLLMLPLLAVLLAACGPQTRHEPPCTSAGADICGDDERRSSPPHSSPDEQPEPDPSGAPSGPLVWGRGNGDEEGDPGNSEGKNNGGDEI